MKRQILGVLLLAVLPAHASHLSDALDLEAKGQFKQAKELLAPAIAEARAAGDLPSVARGLSALGRVSVSLGDYRTAIQNADEAVALRTRLRDEVAVSEDYNTLGLANLYLGNYDAALANYRTALDLDRRRHRVEAEVARRNNIGNVFYFRGQYQDALREYQHAMDTLSAAGEQPWVPRRRQLTIANLATLYQRLGKEQTALDFYRQLTGTPQALPKPEYAQLLLNEGVLYRRMGDPIKALERYRAAQAIFATVHHRDGEIGALRNIGIARAMDLGDLEGARAAFTGALRLAEQSSVTRGIVQATLYRAEVLRREAKYEEAEADLRTALAGAQNTGLVEEEWKALYGLAKLAEAEGDVTAAATRYRQAIAGIESVREGVRRASLRSEFLADKRDVYDSMIALLLRQPNPPVNDLLNLMERSRARTLEERSAPVQATVPHLPADTVLIEFWAGETDSAALWMNALQSGVVRYGALGHGIEDFEQAIEQGNGKELSRALGARLLTGIPAAKHLIVCPDGPFALLPVEALMRSGRLVIEDSDVTYIPAARFIRPEGSRRLLPPWRTQLLALGDPPVSADALGANEQWQPIPAAAEEIRSIARLLPGRSEVYLGPEARKARLLSRRLEGIPLLHFSTHAVADAEHPDRSRILLASDYLFQQEVYGLNLKGVDLATISACETARGKVVRGDGTQAFSQAFLAAGAGATVTSLWRVADRPTAEFMKQFYYALSRGQSKAEALRSAKLEFVKSNSAWSAPRYWAAFVLTGDGWDRCARVVPWSWVLVGTALVLLAASRLVRL